MRVRGDEMAHRQLRRLGALTVVGLTLAGAASAQAAPPATSPGAARAALALTHAGNQHQGGDTGHRVH